MQDQDFGNGGSWTDSIGHSAAVGSSEITQRVLSETDALLGYWDRNLRCQFANAAYKTWFGRSTNEMLGIPMPELLGPVFELNLPFVRGVMAGQVQVFERTLTVADGSVRHSLATYRPDILNREINGFTVHVADVTRFKTLEQQLVAAREAAERQASHDYLTGLRNRTHLAESIQSAIAVARQDQCLAAVMTIDFDNFKRINDRFGHDCGDRVLQELARRMSRALNPTDTVIRFGGDEFVYVASALSTWDPILSSINRLRMHVGQPIQEGKAVVRPSFSCGVAIYPWHGTSATELLHRADLALYRAKAKGPGLVVFASGR